MIGFFLSNRYNTLYETVEPNVSSNLHIADRLRSAWSDHGLPAGGREDEGRGLPEISGSPGYRIRTCLGRCRYPGRDQWLFRSEADHSAAEKETVGGKSPLASEHPAAGHARHSDHRDLRDPDPFCASDRSAVMAAVSASYYRDPHPISVHAVRKRNRTKKIVIFLVKSNIFH